MTRILPARVAAGAMGSIAALFLLAACNPQVEVAEPPAPVETPVSAISSARELVNAMHDRYAGKWFRTLKFQQENTFYTQTGTEQKSRWLQHMSVPGRLRIDFLPLSSRSGLLILNNRVTTFDNGRRVDSRRSIQPVLTLTADVYAIPVRITLRRLDSLGIDLSAFHLDTWQRRPAYVIGAEKGNLESSQVWVDAERLVLVRLIQRDRRGETTIVTDTRVGDYREVEGFLIPFEFNSYRDGKLYFKEQYENVQVNAPILPILFDVTRWARAEPTL